MSIRDYNNKTSKTFLNKKMPTAFYYKINKMCKHFYLIYYLLSKQTVSTVLPKTHKAPDSYINVSVDFGNSVGMIPLNSIVEKAEVYKPKQRITYKLIKEYILEKYSFKVHTAYIAEVKRDLGLPMYDAPNAVETLKQPRKHPTPIQVTAIKDALTYFQVI